MKLTIFLRVKDKFSSYLKYRIQEMVHKKVTRVLHVSRSNIEQCLNLAVRKKTGEWGK